MSTKHTPGPWLYRGKNDAVYTAPPAGSQYQYGTYMFGFHEGATPSDKDLALILGAPDLLAALVPVVKDAEQAEFETWFANELPSGDMDSVHRQWQASSEYRSFCEHWQAQIDAIAKAKGTV